MNAAEFNSANAVGAPVLYWPAFREGDGRRSRTRTPAWTMPSGHDVVSVEGYSGGIALTHVEPIRVHEVTHVGPGNVTTCTCGESFQGGYTIEALELILNHIDEEMGA